MKRSTKKVTKGVLLGVAACGIIYLSLVIETIKLLRRNNDDKKTK